MSAPVEETISEEEIAKRIKEWKEVALFLRRNVVQAEQDEGGSYRELSISRALQCNIILSFHLPVPLDRPNVFPQDYE